MAVPDSLRGFSQEFRLLLRCLRWPLLPADLQEMEAAAHQLNDAGHFIRIAQRHRVAGLVERALRRAGIALPRDANSRLRQLASAGAMQAMALSVESLRLQRLFADHGIHVLFLKGAALAVLAYGDLTVRHAKDIDLLVPLAAALQAMDVLTASGYRPTFDLAAVPPDRRTLWFRYAKSMDWTHSGTGAQLELHWRMTDLPLLGDAFVTAQSQVVTLARGHTLQTLEPDALLAYLCVHGAMHGWMRLKWLADVHALLPREAAACEDTYRRLLQLRAGRAAGQALLLCHDLFQLPLPSGLLRELEAKPVLQLLRRAALHLLQRGGETAEVEHLAFGTTSVYLSRVLLGRGAGQVAGELRTWGFRPDELLTSRLPRPLFFLFPLVRLSNWLRDRLRHGGRSPQPRV